MRCEGKQGNFIPVSGFWTGADRTNGGGIKDACQVAVRLLCIVCLSRFSLSTCRRNSSRYRKSSTILTSGTS